MMLKIIEASMLKTRSSISTAPIFVIGYIHIDKKKVSHPKGKGKAKDGISNQGLKRKFDFVITSTTSPKEAICFYYQDKGHWKHNWLKYLEELNKNNDKYVNF